MSVLPASCLVGSLSSVSTAMETPFSFMPSRQIKGAVRHARRLETLASGTSALMLLSAASAIDS